MIIAIDGPAASGKGTLARRIGERLDLPYLDTGLLYRAVGRRMLDRRCDLEDAAAAEKTASALQAAWLLDDRLRSAEVGRAASAVAIIPGVRRALLQFQIDFARQDGGAVLDGRDIGTVIAPDAHLKIWVTASPEIRARRRFLELQAAGAEVSEAQILADLQARDARDAPNMIRAPDAVVIDTSALDRDGALKAALSLAEPLMRIDHRRASSDPAI